MELLTKWNENHLLHCVMSYELDDRGFESRQGLEFFTSPPLSDRLWGPPGLLSNGYQVLFPWADNSPSSTAEVKNA